MYIKLKDLRIAQRVLTQIDHPVPEELLVYLSKTVEQKEASIKRRRMAKMSDEELERLDNKKCVRLRVHTQDGRFIQFRTNEETFLGTLRELDDDTIRAIDINIGSKPLFHIDTSAKRKIYKGYRFLREKVFVLRNLSGAQRLEILRKIDRQYELGWDIEML